MTLSVTVDSTSQDGTDFTITITKTGSDTGNISILTTEGGASHTDSYDVYGVRASAMALACTTTVFWFHPTRRVKSTTRIRRELRPLLLQSPTRRLTTGRPLTKSAPPMPPTSSSSWRPQPSLRLAPVLSGPIEVRLKTRLSSFLKGGPGYRSIARSRLRRCACAARVASVGADLEARTVSLAGWTMSSFLSRPIASHASHWV